MSRKGTMGGEPVEAPERRLTITVTEGQARILVRATELFSRVHIGQLEQVGWEVERHQPFLVPDGETDEAELARRTRWTEARLLTTMLRALNPLVTGNEHPNYRTDRDRVPDDAHAARDMEMAIRHALWRLAAAGDRNSYTVDADAPHRTSRVHAVPVVLIDGEGAEESQS